MQYLHSTRDLTSTLEPYEHPNLWVDSSYAVYPDMHSHSGMAMSLRISATYSTACRQKLNTKGSMEAESVAIENTMGQLLWT